MGTGTKGIPHIPLPPYPRGSSFVHQELAALLAEIASDDDEDVKAEALEALRTAAGPGDRQAVSVAVAASRASWLFSFGRFNV